jgi:cytidine deaminase
VEAGIKKAASLARSDRELIAAAKQARLRAHAPWSQFKVGAAARFGATIVPGCNVEFDVYGLTNCAERSAIFSAFAIGAARKPLAAVAVVADTPDPVLPCGACRQVLFERGGPELRVILANLRGDARVMRMQELLPEGFRLESQTPAQATVRKRAAASHRKSRP